MVKMLAAPVQISRYIRPSIISFEKWQGVFPVAPQRPLKYFLVGFVIFVVFWAQSAVVH